MKRFFGMMPSSEIVVKKFYRDMSGYKITIEAGTNGWTIIYADSSTEFKDVTKSVVENYNEAYNLAVKRLGLLNEIK